MRTVQLLTRAYEKAKVMEIDENSKYIIFSDCHRGNGSMNDEFSRNENTYLYALNYYYNKGYTYIEAGDGDELWEHKFGHIKKAHAGVFSRIRKFHEENRFILLYGNHNIFLRKNDYVRKNYDTFYDHYDEAEYNLLRGIEPEEALVLKLPKNRQEVFIVHGHQGDFLNDQLWPFAMFSLKYFWRFFHSFGIRNPASPVKNVHKQHKIEKNYKKWIAEKKTMLICGHTHRVKYPKPDELPYFNTGCCVYPRRITGIEIAGGNILLIQWRTVPDAEGIMRVKRKVLRGPEPLEQFDIRREKPSDGSVDSK